MLAHKSDNRIVVGPSEPVEPEERGLNSYTLTVLFTAIMGGLVFGLDIGTTAVLSMDYFRTAMEIPIMQPGAEDSIDVTNQLSLFAVLFHVSSLVGAPFAGQISDKYGRKLVIIIAATLFLAGAVWQSCAGLISQDFAWASILLGRVVGGFGNGFILTIMPVYASELSPAKYRGQTVTFFQLSITAGIFIMALANNFLDEFVWGWRLAFVLQAFPCALILILTLVVLPESPRYLLLVDKEESARVALNKLAKGCPNQTAIVDAEVSAAMEEIERIKSVEEGTFLDLFRGEGYAPFLCGFMVALSQNVTGVNWFMNYATTIFDSLGYNKFAMDLVLKSLNMVATIAAIFVVEKGGRKFLTVWGTLSVIVIFSLVALVIVATGVDVFSTTGDSQTSSVQLFTMIMIFIFQIVFAISWGPLGWIVPGEVFPMRLRGKGMAMCVVANMLTNIALGDYGFQALKVATSLQFTVFILVVMNVVIVLTTVVFLQPETKGVSLEDMRHVFAYERGGSEQRGTMSQFFKKNWIQTLRILSFRGNDPKTEILLMENENIVSSI